MVKRERTALERAQATIAGMDRRNQELTEKVRRLVARVAELEAAATAPCTVVPPPSPFTYAPPHGPCLVTGPHEWHRDGSGATWRELTAEERARHEAWVAMVQLGEEMESSVVPPAV